MTEGSGFGEHMDTDVGVPTEDGESWGEAAERLQPDAMIDFGCPEGCFVLEANAHHGAVDAVEYLIQTAISEDLDPCPQCGAEIEPEVVDGV